MIRITTPASDRINVTIAIKNPDAMNDSTEEARFTAIKYQNILVSQVSLY